MIATWMCMAAVALLSAVNGHAEQLLFMMDDDYVWQYPANDGSHTVVNRPPGSDFTSPVDYTQGYVYARVKVENKPSDKSLGLQLCFWKPGWSPETCSPQMYFSSEGVYYARWGAPVSWWSKGSYDWSTDWYKARVFLKDGNNGSILMATSSCGSYCYSGDLGAHIPVTYDIEIYFTTADHTPNFPGHWNCPAEWGCESGPPEFTALEVSPSAGFVKPGGSLQFTASAVDQFGESLDPQPSVSWTISGGQNIGATGLFTAGDSEGGPYTVRAEATIDGVTKRDSATVSVCDAWTADFDDGTAEQWTVGEGSWEVVDDAYVNTGRASRGSYSSWAGDASWTDLTYTVDITPTGDGTDVWVIFRVQDERNFYLYQLGDNDLYKQVNGEFTKIQDGSGITYATGQTSTIRVELEGSAIRVHSDGDQVIEHTDNTFSAGYIGIGGYQSSLRADNVSVSTAGGSTVAAGVIGAKGRGVKAFGRGERITVSLPEASRQRRVVRVYAADGRLVRRIDAGTATSVSVAPNALPVGAYILRADYGGDRYTTRFIVVE